MGQKFILQICRHFSPFHPIEHLFSYHTDGKSESTYELKMVLDSHSILYILSEASNLEGERESHIESARGMLPRSVKQTSSRMGHSSETVARLGYRPPHSLHAEQGSPFTWGAIHFEVTSSE